MQTEAQLPYTQLLILSTRIKQGLRNYKSKYYLSYWAVNNACGGVWSDKSEVDINFIVLCRGCSLKHWSRCEAWQCLPDCRGGQHLSRGNQRCHTGLRLLLSQRYSVDAPDFAGASRRPVSCKQKSKIAFLISGQLSDILEYNTISFHHSNLSVSPLLDKERAKAFMKPVLNETLITFCPVCNSDSQESGWKETKHETCFVALIDLQPYHVYGTQFLCIAMNLSSKGILCFWYYTQH